MIKALTLLLLLITSPAWAYKFAVGTYAGNGSDNRNIDISDTSSPAVADFQPEFCFVLADNSTSDTGGVWSSVSMGSDQSLQIRAGSARTANWIQAFNSTGFQVGNDSRVNANTQTYYYWCMAPDGNNDFAVGVYSGNATDNRTIDISDTSNGGIADFSPEFVHINCDSTDGTWRSTGNTGDQSNDYFQSAVDANQIQAFNANGFEIGSSTVTNPSGTNNCFYLAIKPVTNNTTGGSYTGNTSDDRDITIGFQPEFVLIKGNSATANATFRTSAHTGDDSCSPADGCSFTNQIQAFGATTFQVGTDSRANENTVTMIYFAIKGQAAASSTRRIAPIFFQ